MRNTSPTITQYTYSTHIQQTPHLPLDVLDRRLYMAEEAMREEPRGGGQVPGTPLGCAAGSRQGYVTHLAHLQCSPFYESSAVFLNCLIPVPRYFLQCKTGKKQQLELGVG